MPYIYIYHAMPTYPKIPTPFFCPPVCFVRLLVSEQTAALLLIFYFSSGRNVVGQCAKVAT